MADSPRDAAVPAARRAGCRPGWNLLSGRAPPLCGALGVTAPAACVPGVTEGLQGISNRPNPLANTHVRRNQEAETQGSQAGQQSVRVTLLEPRKGSPGGTLKIKEQDLRLRPRHRTDLSNSAAFLWLLERHFKTRKVLLAKLISN